MQDSENRKLAVLIDADNAQAAVCSELLAEVSKCTSSDLMEPFDPISKRHFSASYFSSLAC